MRLDEAYGEALSAATSVEVDGDELRLSGPPSVLVFTHARVAGDRAGDAGSQTEPPPVDGTWWLQDGVVDNVPIEVPDGVRIVFVLDGARVSGQAACNGYAASPVIDGDAIQIDELEVTAESCPDRMAEAEAAYLTALVRTTTIARADDRLTLSGDGMKLTFTTEEPLGLPSEG